MKYVNHKFNWINNKLLRILKISKNIILIFIPLLIKVIMSEHQAIDLVCTIKDE
jgi:hypothetical protein